MSTFYPAVKAKVDAILAEPLPVGPLTMWNQIVEVLLQERIAYTVPDVHPSLFMVHPMNRSKLGVNPFNAHRLGARIKKVGADFQELSKATAFEAMPVEPQRSSQVAFNQALVDRSSGMLAPLNGGERYLTVGCGHTVQFCKAALSSCRTPEEELADSTGCLNVQHLTKGDAKLHSMVTTGWSWVIVPWQVESSWPQLPDLAQRALNAANSVASLPSEIEVASSIAEFAEIQQARIGSDGSVDWASCVAAATGSNPPCSDYAHVIGMYVKLFGGGAGAPLLRYLDDFAKSFGANRTLGHEFFKAVTETVFSTVKPYAHLRTGLLATNLVSPKVVDGVSRLLVKSDVEKLKAKNKMPMIERSEKIMSSGWEMATNMMSSGAAKKQDVHPILGRLHTRMILHITAKAKQGFEKKEYSSVDEIEKAFNEELAKLVGSTPPAQGAPSTSSPKGSKHSAPDVGPLDLEEVADPLFIVEQAGFAVGSVVYERAIGTKGLFTLKSVTSEGAILEDYMCNIIGSPMLQAKTQLDTFLKQWAPFKGELPVALPMQPRTGCQLFTVAGSEHLRADRLKAQLLESLFEMTEAVDGSAQLSFFLFPSEVRASLSIPKGKLELVPTTDLKSISCRKGPSSIAVQVGKDTLFLIEPTRPRHKKTEEWKGDVIIAGYWWVGVTTDPAEANMAEKTHKNKDSGVNIPTLVNTQALKEHDKLLIYKAKKQIVPLSDAQVTKKARVGGAVSSK